MQRTDSHYRPHIDGLRAVAVLAVLCYHAFPHLLPGGFAGVDVFFVISGYLITGILAEGFANEGAQMSRVLLHFYARRVRRLFPSLILVLIACYLLAFCFLIPGDLSSLAQKLLPSACFFPNFAFAQGRGYFDGGSITNPLLHLWSLGIEEQFYLIWPLAVALCVRSRVRLAPVAVFLTGLSYSWNALKTPDLNAAAFFLPQMRFWELGIGASCAAILPKRDELKIQNRLSRLGFELLAASGVALIAVSFLFIRGEEGFPNALTLLPTLGAVIVVSSSSLRWANRVILGTPILVAIGQISYALYLWHWPLLSFASQSVVLGNSRGVTLAVLAASFVLAGITTHFVETPIRRSRRGYAQSLTLVSAMAAIAIGAWVTRRYDGFPYRLSPVLRQIGEFRYDRSTAWREGSYFLDPGQDERAFKETPDENVAGRPTMVLWGDSYAAALYPGIKQVFGPRYNIVQRTAALTGAFISDRPGQHDSGSLSRYVFSMILKRRPDVVVIAGQWQSYDWSNIEDTLSALKSAGLPRIILVGPVPEWEGTLKQNVFNYVWRHHQNTIPERLTSGVNLGTIQPIDEGLRTLAAREGIDYVSALTVFGGPDGFLVRTGPTIDTLTTFDGAHLTASGAIYLVQRFPKL